MAVDARPQRDRRGVVFTLIALIIIAYLLSAQRTERAAINDATAQAQIARTRIGVTDAYLVSFEEHASASLAAAGYIALSNISASVRQNGTYVSRLNATIAQCLLNGTIAINGVMTQCLPSSLWLNTSLDRLALIGQDELGLTTRYVLHNVTVWEERPFEVVFGLELSYNVSDPFGAFSEPHRNITARVDITGVPDPLYAKLVQAGVLTQARAFRQTGLLRFELNSSLFPVLYDNLTYVAYEGQSPSVLDRYVGALDRNSTCCGIESVVRRDTLAAPAPAYMNYSFVDHQLARHLAGTLAAYRCDLGEVRAMNPPGSAVTTLVIETVRFDNLYNLTGSQLPACSWS